MSNQILISSGAKLRDLDDVIVGTDGVLTSLGFNVANGVPKLDENGKILVSQLPNSVMEFKGVWNAATNTPTLANGTGNAGDVYLCNVAGTVNFGAGPIAFAVGDYAVYTGSVWARSSGATGTVTSVGLSRDGDALSVTGSPITTSGTINIGFTGTNLQYINGAGNLTTFPDLTVYVPTSRTLTINDVTYDLSANRSWTIDSMIYPDAGIAVSTGTAWGTSIIDNSGNWNTAYNNSIISAAVTGTTTKTLTLDQQDGGTITASWTDYDTAPVTSVFGRTGAVVAVSGDYTTAQVTESGNLYFTDARARAAISLTTLGTSGAATYNNTTGVLNIPNYTTDLTGYVPYTGATTNVNLGTHSLSAYDLIINHTSGSGVAASITKNGAGEALTVVKGSGSGNAASITGGVTLLDELHLTTDLADAYIASAATWNSKQAGSTNLTSLAALTYASTSFVKMTAAGTFALDTNTYALASALSDYVTLATTQTITGQKTISRAANAFGGTTQSFLIDGGAGQAAITLNSAAEQFAYQTFAQGGVAKFEMGIEGTSGNGSFYINSTPQMGVTGASIYVKKSNGFVGINSTNPSFLFSVNNASDIWHAAFGNVSSTGHMLRIGGAATSGSTKYSTLGAYINNTENTGTLLVLQRDGGNVIIGGGSTVSDSGALLQVKGTGIFTASSAAVTLSNAADVWLRVIRGTSFTNIGVDAVGSFYNTNTNHKFYVDNGAINALTIASTGASTFNGAVTIATGVATPFILTSTTNNQYLYIVTNDYEAMTRYENTAAGSWYTGIRTTSGLGSLSSYHIYSSVLAGDAFVLNTNGTGRFASSVTATSFVKTGGTASEYLMADGSVTTGTTAGVTLDTAQTITGAKTFSRNASSFGGTTQSLLIDGAGGNGALTINSSVTGYAYQAFAQNGVAKFEIGIVGTGGNGSLYINRNIQNGETGASIYINKSNGFVGINTIAPPYNFSVYNDSDVWHMSVGGSLGQIRFGGQTGSGGGVIQAFTPASGVRPLFIQRTGGNLILGADSDNGYKLQITGGVSVSAGIVAQAISLNNNAGGITLNRDSTAYYSTVQYQTAGAGKWYIGMRENNGTNDYITFSTTAGDVMRLNQTTGGATFIAQVFAQGFYESSDARIKTLIEDNYLLSSIANVKAKLYKKNGKMELGYYAQDLQEILPSSVTDGKDGFLSLSYSQVHTAKIALIEDEVTILKNRVSELENKLLKYKA